MSATVSNGGGTVPYNLALYDLFNYASLMGGSTPVCACFSTFCDYSITTDPKTDTCTAGSTTNTLVAVVMHNSGSSTALFTFKGGTVTPVGNVDFRRSCVSHANTVASSSGGAGHSSGGATGQSSGGSTGGAAGTGENCADCASHPHPCCFQRICGPARSMLTRDARSRNAAASARLSRSLRYACAQFVLTGHAVGG